VLQEQLRSQIDDARALQAGDAIDVELVDAGSDESPAADNT